MFYVAFVSGKTKKVPDSVGIWGSIYWDGSIQKMGRDWKMGFDCHHTADQVRKTEVIIVKTSQLYYSEGENFSVGEKFYLLKLFFIWELHVK